jgi:hypothetical protein
MLDSRTCHQCGQLIESDKDCARMKNPAQGEIGYIYFHQRGRGDCYWQHLRDTIVSIRSKKPIDSESYQVT